MIFFKSISDFVSQSHQDDCTKLKKEIIIDVYTEIIALKMKLISNLHKIT